MISKRSTCFKKINPKLFLDYSSLSSNKYLFPYSGSYLLARKIFDNFDRFIDSEKIPSMLENMQIALSLNNPCAMYNTGLLFELGIGVRKDEKIAFELFEEAKLFNNCDAEYEIALNYFDGTHYEIDENRGMAILYKLSIRGHPNSCGLLGDLLSKKNNPNSVDIDEVFQHYCNAARGGLEKYAYRAAFIYYFLPAVNAGYDQSILIEQLAPKLFELDDSEGLFLKGVFSLGGKNYQKDIALAEQLLIQSAEKGCVYAQVFLGQFYRTNDFDFPTDIEKSIKYLKMAAKQKDNSAILSLGIYYLKSDNNDKKKAYDYFMSFEDDCTFSYEKYFSYNSIFGVGHIDYVEEAVSFYEKEANNGNDDAAFILGAIFYNMCIFDKAFSCLKRFKKSNHPKGLFYLSLCYFYGLGIKKNLSPAKKYCSQAVIAGNNFAQDLLNMIENEIND